jgi:hypothetical protein
MSRQRKQDIKQEALALLERGHGLLVREGWARGAYARDRHRHPVNPTSPRAVRYCMAGALIRAEHELHGERFHTADEEGIEGSDRFMLALSYLALACSTRLLAPVLCGTQPKEAPQVVRALTGVFHQLPDVANEVPGARREHILACYLLAIDVARTAAATTKSRRRHSRGRRQP